MPQRDRPLRRDGGCLSKLPALRLQTLLESAYAEVFGSGAWHPMQQPEDSAEAVIGNQRMLVSTDFGPPVGTSPSDAGRIAALHAMCDIYSAGGIPQYASAILIVGEEPDFEGEFAQRLLSSLIQTCREEEVEVRGGHTILGQETIIGLTVLGAARNGVVLRKTGGRAGDHLLLSKPLGTGIMLKSRELGLIDDAAFAEALHYMSLSNREAARIVMEAGAHAATDVSGFGLLGHLSEMLGPGQGATLNLSCIPLLKGITGLPDRIGCALADHNVWYVRSRFRLEGFCEISRFYALADPETNGGLLVAAGDATASVLLKRGFHSIGVITGSTDRIVISDEN